MGSVSENGTSRRYPTQRHPKSLPNGNGNHHVAEAFTFASKPPKLPIDICAAEDSKHLHPKGRTLVVCLDGTGDQFDHDNSNVVNFVATLKKDDPNQVVYSRDVNPPRARVPRGVRVRLTPMPQVLGAHGDEEERPLCLRKLA